MATKKTDTAAEVRAIQARLKKSKPTKEKKSAGFKSWGFTRYNDYKQCPLKARLKHIDKIEEPPNEAMTRGSDIDRLCELFIKGEIKTLPTELKKFKAEFTMLAAMYKKTPKRMVIQDSWAVTKDWKPTKWNDWAGCAVRVKIDVGYLVSPTEMRVIDWKTGKYKAERREEYTEQLELYALTAFMLNPALQKVVAQLAYLDHGILFPTPDTDEAKRLTFTRDDIPRLKKTWDMRTRAMLLDRAFAPRPNEKCRWCHYRKENTPNLPDRKQLCKF